LLLQTVPYRVVDTLTSCGGTDCLSTAGNEACFRVPMSYVGKKRVYCKISNGCGDYIIIIIIIIICFVLFCFVCL